MPTPIADMRRQRQAGPRGQDRRHHGRSSSSTMPYYLFDGHAGRRHADRRRPVGAAVAGVHLRRLCARRTTSSSSCPKYVVDEADVDKRAKDAGLRRTGCRCCTSRRTGALNPELPMLGPWKTVQPINTPTWVLERNPVLLGGRHRRQPAAVHRPDQHDAGREPRGR